MARDWRTQKPEGLDEHLKWASAHWNLRLTGCDGRLSKALRDEAVRRGIIIDMEQSDMGFTFLFCVGGPRQVANVQYKKSELMAVLKACYQAWIAEGDSQ